MLLKLAGFVAFALFTVCDSAFVDTLQKCSYKDEKCIAGMIENILKDISKTGVKELNVPAVDPMDLSNTSASIWGLFNITLYEGQINGIKDCVVDSIHTDLDNGATTMNMTCDVIIKGKFKADDVSPMLQNFLGGNAIRANGTMKLKLDKLRMGMQFFYHLNRREDGDIYLECHLDQFRHSFKVGDLKLSANQIFFGDQDISDFVVSFLNQNWNFIVPTFGQPIFDVAMNIMETILHRFFEGVPLKYYLTDDLTSYVKN